VDLDEAGDQPGRVDGAQVGGEVGVERFGGHEALLRLQPVRHGVESGAKVRRLITATQRDRLVAEILATLFATAGSRDPRRKSR
jgi:hypothetical protein